MADTSKVEVRGSITDTNAVVVEDSGLITATFTTGVRQQQTLSLTASTFVTVTVPSGASALLIAALTGTATLKGVTGDTGIKLSTSCPTLIPLGTSPSVGILDTSGSTQTVKVYWL